MSEPTKKNITDAIDAYARAIAGACANFDDGTPNICRTALEAAIAAAIQPVEPPTDAEVEAWEQEATSEQGQYPGTFVLTRTEIDCAVALMRRARATGSLERLRERVQKALDANRSNPMIGTAVCAEEDCLRMVRGWIDEERGAGR